MKKLFENIFCELLVLLLIVLVVFCVFPNKEIHAIRLIIAITSLIVFFLAVLFHKNYFNISKLLECFYEFKEYILKIASEKCISLGYWLQGKLVKPTELDLLSPTILEGSEYVTLLKSAVDDKNICNIAITGAYGSGKSSILKTFQYNYPKYKCLNLSLASFAEELVYKSNNQQDTKGNQTNSGETRLDIVTNIDIEKLEYSLVQQFFYHVKASRIPESRFGRILRISKKKRWILALCIVLMLISIFIVFEESQFFAFFSELKSEKYSNVIKYSLMGFLLLSLIWLIYKAMGYMCHLNSGHLKLMNYEIGIQKEMNLSIFNRYLDELIYMFQRTNYTIVILEDLDRFKNTSIFTKLRELNLLLNQSKDINRRIVFVYALRDSVFVNPIDKAKFFDYIIPVLPYVNVSNSASHFVEKFEAYIREDDSKQGLDKSFLADIAPFIGDYRIIKSIASEFEVNKKFLNKTLELNNLLAMIVYKNLNPQDYELLHDGKGQIKEIFDNKGKLIEDERNSIQVKIADLDEKLKASEADNLRSVDELRAIVISAAARCIPNDYSLYPQNITFNDLNADERIVELLKSGFALEGTASRSRIFITREDLLNVLGQDFDYDKRKKQIEQKSGVANQELKSQREKYQKQLDELSRKTISDLCLKNPSLLNEKSICTNNTLLEFLIRRGYIDEKYFYYITIFKEGILSFNDHSYLLDIKTLKCFENGNFHRQIDDPKLLSHYLIPSDFKSDNILNSELVHTIFARGDKCQKELLTAKLAEGGSLNIAFICEYALTTYVTDGLLASIAANYSNLWIDFSKETFFSNESCLNLFIQLMNCSNETDILNMNSDGQLEYYLSQSFYNKVLMDISTSKAKKIIQMLNPRFKTLIDDRQSTKLLDYLYENGYYDLNESNIWLLINIYGTNKINRDEYKGAIYSAINDSGIDILNRKMADELDFFIDRLILADNNIYEHEDPFISLLFNNDLSVEKRNQLIIHNVSVVKSINKLQNADLEHILLVNNKVEFSFENIRNSYYYRYNYSSLFNEVLGLFVNNNEHRFAEELDRDLSQSDLNIVQSLLFDNYIISDNIKKIILDNEKYKYLWASRVYSLNDNLITYLIYNKKIDFSIEQFKNIINEHKDLHDLLFQKYTKEIMGNIAEFDFPIEYLQKLLDIPKYSQYKEVLLSKIYTNQ